MEFKVDGIEIQTNLEDLDEDEASKYISYVFARKPKDYDIVEIKVMKCDDGKIDVDYTLKGRPFERIRRITGYLSGDLTTWNDSKRAEERERVKHEVKYD